MEEDTLKTEINFDSLSENPVEGLEELRPSSEEVRDKIKDEAIQKLHKEYITKISKHMENGDMPRGVYNKLPKELQRRYRFRNLNSRLHAKGVPMNAEEKEADKKVRKFRARKRKAAKQARKRNRR